TWVGFLLKSVPFVMSNVEADPTGRYILVTGRLHNTPVILLNVYAPNWDDSSFFTALFTQLPNMDTHHFIMGGDMNCNFSSLDCSPSSPFSLSKSARAIKTFLDTYKIIDIWRFHNPTSRSYSFFSQVHKTYSRMDYFFLDMHLLHLVTGCEYQAIVISDHAQW
uniref:Endonuclease/exonuclease/phosphatase domain-containing protein n=1 Tax=Pygocentrus nattereri TaxID=42514 RepID=A0AAR2KJ90_PYGNA